MTGELVAGGKIGEALIFAGPFGGFAQHADQPLGAAILAGHARTRHGEIERAHRRGDFQIDLEGRGVMRTGVENILQCAPLFLRDAVDQDLGAVVVEMDRQGLQRAIPHDGAAGHVPVEYGGAGRLGGEPETRILMHSAELGACSVARNVARNDIRRLLVKLMRQHITIPGRFLQPLGGDHALGRFNIR